MLRPRLGSRFRKLLGEQKLDGLVRKIQRRAASFGVDKLLDDRKREQEVDPDAERSITTVCTLCGVGDSITVDGRGGIVDSKFKMKARGRLGACSKGISTLRREMVHPEGLPGEGVRRATHPMVRDDDGSWMKVPWHGALTEVAETLLEHRKRDGRESIAFYCVGQLPIEDFWLAKKLFQGYLGTNNVGTNCEQCLVANGGGHELVFGTEGSFTRYEDLRDADVVIVIGSNPVLNHPTLYRRYIARSKARVRIVVDPRRSETFRDLEKRASGDQEVHHISIKSGGDVLLFLSVAHLLIHNDWLDHAWLEQNVDEQSRHSFFEEVRTARYSPAEVARNICCHPDEAPALARQIEQLAELWGVRGEQALKVCTVTSVGVNQTTGSNGIACILNCHLLTGQIGREGCGLIRLPGQANAAGALSLGLGAGLLPFRTSVKDGRAREKAAGYWGVPTWFINPKPGTTIANYPQDERISFIFIWGTDPVRNFPNLPAWHKKLRESFVVVVDPYLNDELLEFADVVLPARPATEKTGVIVNGERRFQKINKITDPPFDAWSDTKIMVELAHKVGDRVGPGTFFPEHRVDEHHITEWVQDNNRDLNGVDMYKGFVYTRVGKGEIDTSEVFDEMVSASIGMHNEFVDAHGKPIDYPAIEADADGIRWQGEHRYQPDSREGPLFPDTWRDGFRRAVLFMPPEKYRVDPLPFSEGGLVNLITGRGHSPDEDLAANRDIYNSGHRSGGRRLYDRNYLYLHPDEGIRRGLTEGDRIRIHNEIGAAIRPLRFSRVVPRGHAWMTFHPSEEGSPLNLLTPGDWLDEQTHQPFIKRLQVQLTKVEAGEEPATTSFPAA